ncbi:MAG: universal stress protein [Thermoanaerobaculaceae bacterium]
MQHLARRFASEVRLVHVQEYSRIFPHLASRLEEFNRKDTHRLGALAEELRLLGARQVSYELRTDHLVRGLLAFIAEWEPRLVILGRHGRGGMLGRLIGSTSHAVVRDSRAPVLVVPSRQA